MSRRLILAETAVVFFVVAECAFTAPPPSVEEALALRPRQQNVDYETPPKEKFAQCKVEVEKRSKGSSLVVLGPDGQILRRFVDTDGDAKGYVDQWRYFKDGIEVYREIDKNNRNKPDNFRWLNLGGSRWGVDTNGDGKIDVWKSLSAAEASQEVIRAVASGDDDALKALLLTAEDVKKLDIDKPIAEKLLASVQEAPKKAKAVVSKSKVLTSQSKWTRFDALMPGIIPADDGKAGTDLLVYENAMAIVESGKTTGLVQIGEMIHVGDVWKITQAPVPIESNESQVMAGGILMQPVVAENNAVVGAPSPEMQKLLDQLEKLDKQPPAPDGGKDALAKYNNQRADLLVKIYNLAESDDEKVQWMKQLIDSLAASVQTGAFPAGLTRLKALEGQLISSSPKSLLVPYAVYRRIFSEYTVDLAAAEQNKRANVLTDWLKNLEDFIKQYPEADDAPDAMLQLAMNEEFMGKSKDAQKWYQQIVSEKSKSSAAKKAQGAITRLSLDNKAITIAGPNLKGGNVTTASYQNRGVVLVMYWVTWYQPGIAELPELRALYTQFHEAGFEIIGVPLDIDKQAVEQYIGQNKITWPQIYQPGGLDSPLAVQYGIFSPPVMFLLDKNGKVISRNITVAELKQQLPQLLKGK